MGSTVLSKRDGAGYEASAAPSIGSRSTSSLWIERATIGASLRLTELRNHALAEQVVCYRHSRTGPLMGNSLVSQRRFP
jgi:hypothetical protein